MTAGAKRQLLREMWMLSRMRLRLLHAPLTAHRSRTTFTQAELDKFVQNLPPGVVPWPLFTDDQNPQ